MTEQAEKSFAIALRETLESRQEDIAKTLAGKLDPERFIRVALLAVTKNKKLWECTRESVLLSVMESARTGLMIDNKEAALIPYGNQAEFMPMVQGIIRLMLRSPGLLKVEARTVREGDAFEYWYGARPDLRHIPHSSQGEITHAYAVMWRQGTEPTFEVISRDEIEQIRSSSRAPNSPAWQNWYGEMARKAALKRLAKYADLSPEATRAIELDHLVTGDSSWGTDYADGASEAYQSQVIKGKTQARLTDLKERLAEKDEPVDDPLPADPPPSEPRQENQWEPAIVTFIAETGLTGEAGGLSAEIHVRSILNLSPFMAVPFGQLDIVEATAYVYGWAMVKQENDELDSAARSEIVNRRWADEAIREPWIDWAIRHIPPENGEAA